MALVVVALVMLLMGVVEFGRAFMITNMVTDAARNGARSAALVPTTSRDANGPTGTPKAAIVQQVVNEIQSVTGTLNPAPTVVVAYPTPVPSAPAYAQVTVQGSIPYVFGFTGTSCGSGSGRCFSVNRTVTFRDEVR